MHGMLRFDGKKNPARRQALERNEFSPLEDVEGGFVEYRKTATTFAKRMDIEFEVDTLEGLHRGKPGDFLAVGAAGEMYPIDAAVFAATYERVDQ